MNADKPPEQPGTGRPIVLWDSERNTVVVHGDDATAVAYHLGRHLKSLGLPEDVVVAVHGAAPEIPEQPKLPDLTGLQERLRGFRQLWGDELANSGHIPMPPLPVFRFGEGHADGPPRDGVKLTSAEKKRARRAERNRRNRR